MALAEARAVWQRTANRCLAQEDAKRAPKLACCPSIPPSVKQADTGHSSAYGGQDVPRTISIPYNLNASYSDLSPSSKWWLKAQPNYSYHQKGLMDKRFSSVEGITEICHMQENSGTLAINIKDPSLIDQTTSKNSSCDNPCRDTPTGDKKDFGVKEDDNFRTWSSWNYNDPFEVKESSWIEVDKNTPWWRTADTDELASLVAQRSLDHIENCDLPRPQNTRVKNNVDNICFARDGISSSLLDSKLIAGNHHHYNTKIHTADSMTAENNCHKLESQAVSSADKPLRDIPTHERMLEMHTSENDPSKAQLMEALRHSQTRAREAERAAQQACAEKEHVVKLVFRQASQLFAYKQWLHLLQLESMYLQFICDTSQSVSRALPPMLPWTPQRTRKKRKNEMSSCKILAEKCFNEYEASKYSVVLALGLGLGGAGFLLGWTIGWMLPTW